MRIIIRIKQTMAKSSFAEPEIELHSKLCLITCGMHLRFKMRTWKNRIPVNRIIKAQRNEWNVILSNSFTRSFFASMCLITGSYYCNQRHSNISDVSCINDNTTSIEHRAPDTKTRRMNEIILNMQFTPQIPQFISSLQCTHAELLLVQYYRCICSRDWMCNWSGNERYDT